jgi:16S rRNA (guanine966-N2)-methyltransferase
VRVVAGVAGGQRLDAPPGQDTRPTSDRVREAVFNALTSLDAVEDVDALDLFAGSGALGIEALSRGARHATFVERAPAARRVLEANLLRTGLAPQATVVAGTAEEHVRRMRSEPPAPAPVLLLLDPPYAYDAWAALLDDLAATSVPGSLAVVESDRLVACADPWEPVRDKRYGGTAVRLLRRR